VKRQTIAIFLVVIIALPVASILLYTHLTFSDNEAPKNLKITDFTIAHPDVLVWGYVYWRFNVTVQNWENQGVSGITLEVRMLNDETKTVLWNYTEVLGTLRVGEKRVIAGNASTNMDAWEAYMARYKVESPKNITSFHALLTFGTLTIDERKVETHTNWNL
jgi:hypothetical protein